MMEHITSTSENDWFPCPGNKKRSYLLKLRTNSCYPRCHLIYLPAGPGTVTFKAPTSPCEVTITTRRAYCRGRERFPGFSLGLRSVLPGGSLRGVSTVPHRRHPRPNPGEGGRRGAALLNPFFHKIDSPGWGRSGFPGGPGFSCSRPKDICFVHVEKTSYNYVEILPHSPPGFWNFLH